MYTQVQFTELMKNMEQEFSSFLANAESTETSVTVKVDQPLAKSEDESKKDESKDKKPEAKEDKEEPKSDDKAPPAFAEEKPAAEAAPSDEAQAPAQEAPQAEGEAPAQAAQGDEACDYDQEDLEHMNQMYSTMSRAELMAHHDAVKAALDAHGMAKCGDMAMAKSEVIEVNPSVVSTAESELLKSELSAEKAKSEELKKSLETATDILNRIFTKKSAPTGKAITNLEVIAKSESAQEEKVLTKSEITRILNSKSSDPSLKKSDRDAINAYCLNGASINTINHLLK